MTIAILAALTVLGPAAGDPLPPWAIGPFAKLPQPVLEPAPASTFECPVSGKVVRWESQDVYNPAIDNSRK